MERNKGITYIEGRVKGPSGKEKTVKFLIDTGAKYSLLPKKVWKAIGLKPKRKMAFILADGTTVERAVSEAYIVLPQGEGHTPLILGREKDEALLGVVTLEILGLVFNPFDRTLNPSGLFMYGGRRFKSGRQKGEPDEYTSSQKSLQIL